VERETRSHPARLHPFPLAELAGQEPSLAERQPYRAAVERDSRWLDEAIVKHYHGDDADLGLLLGTAESAFEGMKEDWSAVFAST
jgi:hypothetical protein